ncbi:MAG TPA: histidine phosphatase family protein [Gemmatimonadaceae bacterium]|nr:histidine phosphatase family protein [Gemmatimonadaceae bacterium]
MPMRLPLLRLVLSAAALLGCATRTPAAAVSPAPAAAAVAAGPTVIVVRHAEKASAASDDPALSAAGEARAAALADLLGGGRVTGIVVTQFRRSRQTAAPLAARRGLTPIVVPAANPIAAHEAAVAAAARGAGGPGDTVVVVAHSNTVAGIVHALGGAQLPDLCDRQYASIFTVAPQADGSVRVAQSTYGAADPADATSCHVGP